MRALGWLANSDNAETVAFAATLLCTWAAAQGALMLPRKSPRVFTAAALFAANWAVLLLFYLPGPPQDEILSSLSGFLLVYSGIFLIREAARDEQEQEPRHVGWVDKLPVHLFRITLGGYGVYLIAKRVLRLEYGYGTLAVAVWGTVLTILGYAVIWLGLAGLQRAARSVGPASALLGALLILYSGLEVTYTVWYGKEFWPAYHRFLLMESRPGAPQMGALIPVDPRPDWPESDRWYRLEARPDWPRNRQVMALQVVPRTPEMWTWLKYALAGCKVLFTAGFLALLWRRPETAKRPERRGLFGRLTRRLHLGPV